MLTRLTLRNFQPHETIALDLAPGTNVLVGPSDSGKSAVLRGLRWLALNQPDGDGFIRHGASSASATLELDGHKVRRRRGRGVNSYRLDGQKPLVSFGRGKVPADVAALLNLGPLNFQPQHDAPFWLGLPPAQVARELNTVVNLEQIDHAQAHAAARVRRAQAELAVCKRRLEEARSRRDALAWVKDARRLWNEAEALRMEAAKARNRAALGASLLARAAQATLTLENAANAILGKKTALEAGEAALTERQRADRLDYLLGKVSQLTRVAEPLPVGRGDLDRLEGLGRKALAERQRADRLASLLRRQKNLKRLLASSDSRVDGAKGALAKATDGTECPVCGGVMGTRGRAEVTV